MSYERRKEQTNAAAAKQSAASRDIVNGWDDEQPSDQQINDRDACRLDFRRFLETYFAGGVFYDQWSPDHLKVIAKVEEVVLHGGLYACAMPRSWGKTAVLTRGVLWALLYGHRRYPILLAATEPDGKKLLEQHIKRELTRSETLRRPFRGACYPLRRLGGDAKRARGQLFRGVPTSPGWGAEQLILANMPDDAFDGGPNVSGHSVEVAGLTSSLRGKNLMLPDMRLVRPDCLMLDDPQTRESAKSPTQCAERLQIIRGDAMGLAGERLAALAAVTIIREGDVASQILDRELNPEWQGFTTSAVHKWPKRLDLWDEYQRLRRDGLRRGKGTKAATAYYRKNRKAMDAGAVLSWPQRKGDKLTALQWVMDKKAEVGEEAWAAEYMNSPLKVETDSLKLLTAAEVAAKVNHHPRFTVPLWADILTSFIDVHGDVLFYVVLAARRRDFSTAVIDYGTFPDQPQFVSKRKAATKLQDVFTGAGPEAAVRAGIIQLATRIVEAKFNREDGLPMRVERMLVDCGWGQTPTADAVRSIGSPAAMLSRGRPMKPGDRKISQYPLRDDETLGDEWILKPIRKGLPQLVATMDVNHWKTFVAYRLNTPIGDPSALSLFGDDPRVHAAFADHLTSETVERVDAKGNSLDVWSVKPGCENHWFDCLVGAHVAASMLGCTLPGMTPERPPEPEIADMSRRIPWSVALAGMR